MSDLPRRSWWGRNWKWVVPVGCLTPILVCGGVFTLILSAAWGMLRYSPPYEKSLEMVRVHPRVVEVLGSPIDPGYLVNGSIEVSGSSGRADLGYPVSGPKGSGSVFVKAEKSAGQWRIHRLAVDLDPIREQVVLVSAPSSAP